MVSDDRDWEDWQDDLRDEGLSAMDLWMRNLRQTQFANVRFFFRCNYRSYTLLSWLLESIKTSQSYEPMLLKLTHI